MRLRSAPRLACGQRCADGQVLAQIEAHSAFCNGAAMMERKTLPAGDRSHTAGPTASCQEVWNREGGKERDGFGIWSVCNAISRCWDICAPVLSGRQAAIPQRPAARAQLCAGNRLKLRRDRARSAIFSPAASTRCSITRRARARVSFPEASADGDDTGRRQGRTHAAVDRLLP